MRKRTGKEDKERLKNISKKIKKHIRDKRGQKTRNATKSTSRIQGYQEHLERQIFEEKAIIPKIKDEKGETVTSRKRIANVFGKFSSKLFAEERQEDEDRESEEEETRTGKENEEGEAETASIPEFTEQDTQVAIVSLKKGKAGDSNGIKAEDISVRRRDEKVDERDLQ